MNTPAKIVSTENRVVISTICADSPKSLSMAFAMMKLLTAVGEAKSI